jgi:ElaB/YqjD/DUF883 family membrane-anchored ribosome-binding protein
LLDALEAAEDKEDIKAVAEELQEFWKKMKHKSKQHSAKLMHGSLEGIIHKNLRLEDHFECALEKLEEEDIDTEEMEALMDTYSEHIDAAGEYLAELEELIDDSTSVDLEEIQKLVKKAKEKLKSAHKVLNYLTKAIRETGVDVSDCKPDDFVVVEDHAQSSSGKMPA